MKDKIKEYLTLPYSTFVIPDVTTDNEPCYVAYHPELEGCMSHGNTPEEALHNLREVTQVYVSALLEKGLEVPRPQAIERKIDITWDVVSPTSVVEVDTYISPSVTPLVFAPAT
jgi:predicted RNase H-like HicB family nuclease